MNYFYSSQEKQCVVEKICAMIHFSKRIENLHLEDIKSSENFIKEMIVIFSFDTKNATKVLFQVPSEQI